MKIKSVYKNLTLRWRQQAHQQIDNSAFTTAGRANESNTLTKIDPNRHIFQDSCGFLPIRETNTTKNNTSPKGKLGCNL